MIISQLNLSLICFFLNENLPRVCNSNFSYPVHDLNLSMPRIIFIIALRIKLFQKFQLLSFL